MLFCLVAGGLAPQVRVTQCRAFAGRCKSNKNQVRYSLRAASNLDPEFALHATGFVIRELGWGR